ncbi:MAG: pitrilysin family protein [Candidatus Neomarinimicrobiota bacterium]
MRFIKTIALLIFIFITGCSKQTAFSIENEKYVLENGLQVILHEDKSDPIVSVAIMYHVGSNREVVGRTGFAHLFEHMLFQESQHVPQDQFFKIIQNAGGTLNGGTWKDGTIYYEVVPKNALEMVLWLESDRMGWLLSTVTQEAFENQQEVVQNEKRQRVDNRPYGHTNYVIVKNLYPADHPYNWTTIGDLEDLKNATIDDVRNFYKQWYGPNNATLVIAGDYDKNEIKNLVEKYFGEIAPGPKVTDPIRQHISLSGIKRVYHEDNFAKSPELNMVFPTVDQSHEDAPALQFLGQLLSDGKKAPLYKVIVEELKLAPAANSYSDAQEITGTFDISIRTFPDISLTQVEAAVKESFARFEKDGFSEEDLDRIKAKYETGFYQGISSVLGKSFQLSQYNVFFGTPDYITEDFELALAVTHDDILNVYQKYIKDKNYLITSFVPKGQTDLIAQGSKLFPIKEEKIVKSSDTSETEEKAAVLPVPRIAANFDRSIQPALGLDPVLNIPNIWKFSYKQGTNIFGVKQSELPLINFAVTLKGGLLLDDPEKIGVANLMSDIMMEGTANKTPLELEEAIDALGSSISMYTNDESIVLVATTLKSRFDETMALTREILLEPRWDEIEFERIKLQTIESINRSSAVPRSISRRVFKKLNYGKHIKANNTYGSVPSVQSIKIDDLKSFYARNFSPSVTSITIAGDINRSKAVAAFKGLIEKWELKDVDFPAYELPQPAIKSQVYFVDVPGAKQSEIRIGNLALSRTDKDFYPAYIMNMKLGGNFNGNVNLVLREEKGFTYGARTGFSGTEIQGTFTASAAVRSNATEESVAIFKELMEKYREPVSNEDLAFTKNVLLKSNARRFETLSALRGMLESIAKYDLPFDYIKDQENIVQNTTVDSHNDMARKYIKPDRMNYLIVGDAKTQFEGLKSLGFGDPVLLDTEGNLIK